MNDYEWLDKLCRKFNNMQSNGFWVERSFRFNEKNYYVHFFQLDVNDRLATDRELREFREAYQEFNK